MAAPGRPRGLSIIILQLKQVCKSGFGGRFSPHFVRTFYRHETCKQIRLCALVRYRQTETRVTTARRNATPYGTIKPHQPVTSHGPRSRAQHSGIRSCRVIAWYMMAAAVLTHLCGETRMIRNACHLRPMPMVKTGILAEMPFAPAFTPKPITEISKPWLRNPIDVLALR